MSQQTMKDKTYIRLKAETKDKLIKIIMAQNKTGEEICRMMKKIEKYNELLERAFDILVKIINKPKKANQS